MRACTPGNSVSGGSEGRAQPFSEKGESGCPGVHDTRNQAPHVTFAKQVRYQNGFKIAHVNVRSLYPKFDEISLLLTGSSLDVLCLSETWLDETISNSQIGIPGYIIERNDRNRQGGGVMMYIRESIDYHLRDDIASCPSICIENIWIEIKLSQDRRCLVCCLYRPPSASTAYYNAILDTLDKATLDDKDIFVAGDLNFDYKLDESLSSNPIHYIENLYSMTQIIHQPTRVTKNSTSLIDLMLTTLPELHHNTKVYEFAFSDHFLIYTCIKVSSKARKHRTIRYRSYKDFNEEQFVNDLFGYLEVKYSHRNHRIRLIGIVGKMNFCVLVTNTHHLK